MATSRARARAARRAGARARAQASARKRVAARKASGRKPSGANRAARRAAARERAQAAAKKRVAARKAAGRKPSGAKSRSQRKADARKKAQAMAKKRIAAKATAAKARPAAKKGVRSKPKQSKVTKPTTTFNKELKNIQKNQSFGPVADGATYARNITNYNMKYGKTPAIRAKAYEQSLNKKSFKGLSDGQTFGVGPVASGDAYARGLNTDNQNVENRLRQVRNLGSTLTGGLISPVRKLTDKEIADRRMKVQAKRQAKFMGRKTGGKNKNKRNKEVNTLPFESAGLKPDGFGFGILGAAIRASGLEPAGFGQKGMKEDNLTRIQNEAYNTALSNSMAGLAGDFDFGTQGSEMSISQVPGLQAGQSRGLRRIRRFNSGRRRDAGDSLRRGGRRIQDFISTQLNI